MKKILVTGVSSTSVGRVMPASAQRRLAELYARHAASALRLAFLMTGDSTAAEDLVQEAFTRVFARFQDRKPPHAIEAYLRRTIINLSHDRYRRLKTMRVFLARAVSPATSQEPPDIEGQLVMRSRLQRLPPRQRAAVVLRYYEDLSENEAAEILNCSVAALKQLLQRGLRTLREQQRGDSDE